ncbi:MAG TPA: MlaD family protein [Solirubrobacteraceae bacterium]|jgi:virulence factor Mce-like protein
MVTQAPKRAAVLAAVGFALSCIGLVIFVWTQFGGSVPFAPQGYRVHVMFKETGLLVPGADVRIAGVNVGRVAAVSNRGVNSLVTIDISQQYAPIPTDTRAILRQKTLLGEAYVALSAGDRSGPTLADGGTIPRSQVASTQQLDQVLNSFGKPTQQDLQEFMSGSATALAGQGESINGAIANLDPALGDLNAIVGVLDGEQGSVRQLLRSGATVFTTLGQRSSDLQSLITAGNGVLSATAERNAALNATVNAMPPFERRLRATLDHAKSTLAIAKPSLDALLPAAPLLTPTLRGLITLSGPALRLLHAAPRLVNDSIVALPAIERFQRAFHPALKALLPAVNQVSPMINFIGLYQKELVAAMANLAASTEATAPGIGGNQHYLRSLAIAGNESVFGQTVRSPSNRSNAYFSPGELDNIKNGGLLAASCDNTGNKPQTGFAVPNIPCKVQPGFRWGGITRYFPHVTSGSNQ